MKALTIGLIELLAVATTANAQVNLTTADLLPADDSAWDTSAFGNSATVPPMRLSSRFARCTVSY